MSSSSSLSSSVSPWLTISIISRFNQIRSCCCCVAHKLESRWRRGGNNNHDQRHVELQVIINTDKSPKKHSAKSIKYRLILCFMRISNSSLYTALNRSFMFLFNLIRMVVCEVDGKHGINLFIHLFILRKPPLFLINLFLSLSPQRCLISI